MNRMLAVVSASGATAYEGSKVHPVCTGGSASTPSGRRRLMPADGGTAPGPREPKGMP